MCFIHLYMYLNSLLQAQAYQRIREKENRKEHNIKYGDRRINDPYHQCIADSMQN